MKKIPEYIYRLNNLGFSLWIENEKLKYRLYQECANKNDILEEISIFSKLPILLFLNSLLKFIFK